MLQPKKPTAKKPAGKKITKKSTNPADSYPNKKDKRGNLLIGGGEGTRAPFKTGGKLSKARNGKPVKKALLGSVLGGMGKQVLGGLASKALGGLFGGGGGATAQGGQGPVAQAPMQKRRSTDMTPVKTRGMKKGGKVSKAKNGTSLGMKSVKAGFDKNPGVTRADIITAATKKAKTGTSVPKKNSVSKNIGNLNKAKKGATVKKAAMGIKVVPKNLNKRQLERVQRINETNPERSRRVANRISDRRNARGAENLRMNGDAQFNMKSGGSMKKCKYGCK